MEMKFRFIPKQPVHVGQEITLPGEAEVWTVESINQGGRSVVAHTKEGKLVLLIMTNVPYIKEQVA
jgi:hypothetical protein